MAYHIAAQMPTLASWVTVQEEVPGTVAEQDEANAREAEERAAVTRAEVLALIRVNTPIAAAAIRAVTPEWMKSTVRFGPAGGAEMSVERLVRDQRDPCQQAPRRCPGRYRRSPG